MGLWVMYLIRGIRGLCGMGAVWLHSTHTTNPTNRHELINVRIRGILQISCPNRDALRFCYDTGTIELRIFVGFGSNRSNIVNNSLRFTIIDYEYCTNVMNQIRIS